MTFAPSQRAQLSHWLGSVAVVRLSIFGCTLETSLSAQIAVADRTLSSALRTKRSSETCSPGPAGIAQQTLDLQMTVQTDARGIARVECSNLTAYTPAVYHPYAVVDLVGGAMPGSRLARRLDSGLKARGRLWTCYVLNGYSAQTPATPNKAPRQRAVEHRFSANTTRQRLLFWRKIARSWVP